MNKRLIQICVLLGVLGTLYTLDLIGLKPQIASSSQCITKYIRFCMAKHREDECVRVCVRNKNEHSNYEPFIATCNVKFIDTFTKFFTKFIHRNSS